MPYVMFIIQLARSRKLILEATLYPCAQGEASTSVRNTEPSPEYRADSSSLRDVWSQDTTDNGTEVLATNIKFELYT